MNCMDYFADAFWDMFGLGLRMTPVLFLQALLVCALM